MLLPAACLPASAPPLAPTLRFREEAAMEPDASATACMPLLLPACLCYCLLPPSQRFGEEAAKEPMDRTNVEAGKYAASCCQVAQELGVPCLDLWTEMQKVGRRGVIQGGGRLGVPRLDLWTKVKVVGRGQM